MGRGVQVTFDAADPHALARWWAELLGYQIEDSHDLVSRLLADGAVTEAEVASVDGRLFLVGAVAASDPAGHGPRLFFQQVPEPKSAKNRVHLDVPVPASQLDAEVKRLVAAGASLTGYNTYPGHRSAVLRDPEGNEFCLH
jgi:glyoxalase superfamily protein